MAGAFLAVASIRRPIAVVARRASDVTLLCGFAGLPGKHSCPKHRPLHPKVARNDQQLAFQVYKISGSRGSVEDILIRLGASLSESSKYVNPWPFEHFRGCGPLF